MILKSFRELVDEYLLENGASDYRKVAGVVLKAMPSSAKKPEQMVLSILLKGSKGTAARYRKVGRGIFALKAAPGGPPLGDSAPAEAVVPVETLTAGGIPTSFSDAAGTPGPSGLLTALLATAEYLGASPTLRTAVRRPAPRPVERFPLEELKFGKPEVTLDQKTTNQIFSMERGWEVDADWTIGKLRDALPPGVVSPKATRVAVWGRLKRAFQGEEVAKFARSGRLLLVTLSKTHKLNLVTLDLASKRVSCSCEAFNNEKEKERLREAICKHLLQAVFVHRKELIERGSALIGAARTRQWSKSASFDDDGLTWKSNFTYYFVREVFPLFGFRTAHYTESVGDIVKMVEGIVASK